MYVDEAVANGAVLQNGSDGWEPGGRAIADLRADWAGSAQPGLPCEACD